MKRKGEILDEQLSSKKSAVAPAAAVAALAAATINDVNVYAANDFKLTDFPDEVLKQVYSNLSFKQRQITRRTCHRLLEFVDKSTPGAKQLFIRVIQTLTRGTMPFVIRMKPYFYYGDPESSVYVEVGLSLERWSLDTEALQKLLGSLPPLRIIRPEVLFLDNPVLNTPRGLFIAGLLRHMIGQQVPRSVTEIGLSCSAPLGAEPEVQQAFSEFENLSCNGVQKLRLYDDGTHILLPTAACFTRLVSLVFDIYSEASVQALTSVSGHPTLRELSISDEHYYSNTSGDLMSSLAAFRNVEKLALICDCELWEDEADNSEVLYNAFGNMIRGMENLKCLHTLSSPSVQFWQYLMEHNVVGIRLEELKIFCNEDLTHEELDAMVQGLQTFAPSLTTLCLRVGQSYHSQWDELSIGALSGVRYHPSLTKLELKTERQFGQESLSNLQQGLGNKVKLCHGPFY